MGVEIDRDSFTAEEREAFRTKLAECVEALAVLLARPGFGEGPTTIGAEMELDLVDERGRPVPVGPQVLAALAMAELTYELGQFNLEYNAPPLPIAGRPFAALQRQLEAALARIAEAAAPYGASPLAVGILPTLEASDLAPPMMTGSRRYRALSNALKAGQEGGPFALRIEGRERLETSFHDITTEVANTSFQVHLRCSPSEFASTYNAAQLVTAPLVAVAASSPFFLGHVLWDETRIALFRQAVDDRPGAMDDDWRPARVSFGHGWVRRGAHELFAEAVALYAPLLPVLGGESPLAIARAGGLPSLSELRLHQGTLWRWNRAIYDPGCGGHLRVELRATPSGPTPIDMAANAALAVGATLAMRADAERWLPSITFGQARRNFYQAARYGMDAELLWPRPGASQRLRPAPEVILGLCDRAEEALRGAGVAADDASGALDVVRERVRRRQNGATWLRRSLDAIAASSGSRAEQMQRLTAEYLARAREGTPVHAWPLLTR